MKPVRMFTYQLLLLLLTEMSFSHLLARLSNRKIQNSSFGDTQNVSVLKARQS